MHKEQTVSEMVEEVHARQAKALVERTGQPFQDALEAVAGTVAGRQLGELANGEHRDERARDWQEGLALKRAEERHYWWDECYMESLKSKEARAEYYTRLEEVASSCQDKVSSCAEAPKGPGSFLWRITRTFGR